MIFEPEVYVILVTECITEILKEFLSSFIITRLFLRVHFLFIKAELWSDKFSLLFFDNISLHHLVKANIEIGKL